MVICLELNYMMADLWHFVFPCFLPERWKAKTQKHVFLSLFRLSGRRHENKNYARRNKDILSGEGTKISLMKISCRWVDIVRVVALSLLCLRVFISKCEGRNNDKWQVSYFRLSKGENMNHVFLSLFRLSGRKHEIC